MMLAQGPCRVKEANYGTGGGALMLRDFAYVAMVVCPDEAAALAREIGLWSTCQNPLRSSPKDDQGPSQQREAQRNAGGGSKARGRSSGHRG